jgi:hypothetical protein
MFQMDGKISNSRGVHVANIRGNAVFDLKGERLYALKGTKVYKLSGELVGHLPTGIGSDRRLDKTTSDRLFPSQ